MSEVRSPKSEVRRRRSGGFRGGCRAWYRTRERRTACARTACATQVGPGAATASDFGRPAPAGHGTWDFGLRTSDFGPRTYLPPAVRSTSSIRGRAAGCRVAGGALAALDGGELLAEDGLEVLGPGRGGDGHHLLRALPLQGVDQGAAEAPRHAVRGEDGLQGIHARGAPALEVGDAALGVRAGEVLEELPAGVQVGGVAGQGLPAAGDAGEGPGAAPGEGEDVVAEGDLLLFEEEDLLGELDPHRHQAPPEGVAGALDLARGGAELVPVAPVGDELDRLHRGAGVDGGAPPVLAQPVPVEGAGDAI